MNQNVELFMAHLMRFLPIKMVSQIGAHLGRKEILSEFKKNEPWIDDFYHTIESLTGIGDPNEKKKLLIEFGDQVGRVYAEAVILQKIDKKGLIDVEGLENIENLTQPVIFVAPHLSNWEILAKVCTLFNNPTCILYEPRESNERMAIANKSRLAWGENIKLLSSDEPMVMKKILSMLKNNFNLFILSDEEKGGYVYAPSLGRNIPYAGNRWLASRLAVKYSLDVIPLYVERVKATNFVIHIEKKISPQTHINTVLRAKKIADKIDELFELWVRKRPEHWYWMPHLDLNKTIHKQ